MSSYQAEGKEKKERGFQATLGQGRRGSADTFRTSRIITFLSLVLASEDTKMSWVMENTL